LEPENTDTLMIANLIRRSYGFTNKFEVGADWNSAKVIGKKNTAKALLEMSFRCGGISKDVIGRLVALAIM